MSTIGHEAVPHRGHRSSSCLDERVGQSSRALRPDEKVRDAESAAGSAASPTRSQAHRSSHTSGLRGARERARKAGRDPVTGHALKVDGRPARTAGPSIR